jgi:hypothetical protein
MDFQVQSYQALECCKVNLNGRDCTSIYYSIYSTVYIIRAAVQVASRMHTLSTLLAQIQFVPTVSHRHLVVKR